MSDYIFIDIDFETRSELNITEVGTHKYALHPSTEILIIGFSFDEGKTVYDYDPYHEEQSLLDFFIGKVKKLFSKKNKDRKKVKIRAFNSMFEYLIWTHVGVKQFGFPKLKIDDFYCVMAEACAMGFPASLENCAKALGLVEQKDSAGSALIRFFSKPSRAKGEYWKDPLVYEDKFMMFKRYCQQDVVVQIEISKRCRKLSPFQFAVFVLTERMNTRGLPIDLDMIHGALNLVDIAKKETDTEIQKLSNGEITSPSQTKVLTEWLNKNGFKIDNLQAATIDRTLKRNIDPLFRKMLELRKNGSKSSIAKYNKALVYICDNGYVYDFIKYHIASTGRWGGRGIQIQNYPKPHKDFPKKYDHNVLCDMIANKEADLLQFLYGSVSECLKAAARGMIKAEDGYKFVGADYSQIEARIVMWLAGDKQGLKDFSGEGKIYEAMASRIFNVVVKMILKGSFERDVGKETVLGCGFGMGWKKFLERCVMDRGLSVTESIAKNAVKGYRERYPEVKKAWSACEQAAIQAINNPGVKYLVCKGKLVYLFEKNHLFCRLPSGRKLCYPFAYTREEVNQWGKLTTIVKYKTWNQKVAGNKWVSTTIWGGTLFQHGVQASAADLMANGMLTAEKHGYITRFTVHDESAAISPDKPEYNYKEYEKLLCTLPEWAKGLPVVAEGFEGYRYAKY